MALGKMMSTAMRVLGYLKQTGRGELTPRQRRRVAHKRHRAGRRSEAFK